MRKTKRLIRKIKTPNETGDLYDGIQFLSAYTLLLYEMEKVISAQMLQSMYDAQEEHRRQYLTSALLLWQLRELEVWEQDYKKALKRAIEDEIKRTTVLVYYASDTKYDIIKVEIGDRLLREDKGVKRGLGGRIMRLYRYANTRGRSITIMQCYDELISKGHRVDKHWLYTYESKVPRSNHLAHDGVAANEDGLFTINGKQTYAPGFFNDPSEDSNCRCSMYLEVDETINGIGDEP